MKRRELVLRWLAAVGREGTDRHWKDEHRLAGLLVDFRGPRLRALLEGVPDADEICERHAEVVAGSPPDGGDLYVVVRAPEARTREESEQLVRAHFDALGSLAMEAGETDLAAALRAEVPIVWRDDHLPMQEHDGVGTWAYEVLGDWFHGRESDHPALGLREAAYTIAASYEIARFVLWPAHRLNVATPDPYRAYVRLFRSGDACWRRDDAIHVWASPARAAPPG